MRLHLALMSSASLVAVAFGGFGSARAQSRPAAAQNSTQLPEVVVTAQKRTEKLSDLTVTASVLSAETLATNNVSNISDINKLVPGVNLNGTFNGRAPLGIRGISSDSNEGAVGIASGVGIEIDGVPIPSDSFAGNDVEDIANIEILEGPQATLGGRTATSGLINYITHKPTTFWTGDASVSETNDQEQHYTANVSGPLLNNVFMSLAAWDHTTIFPDVNLDTNSHSSDKAYGVRAKIQANLTDKLTVTLEGRASANRSEGDNFSYSYVYPGAFIFAGLGGGPPVWSQSSLFPSSLKIGPHNTAYASPDNDIFEHRYDKDVSLILNYKLGDYTLTSTTAYQQEDRTSKQDLFVVNEYYLTAAGIPSNGYQNSQIEYIDTYQTSEELKISSPFNQKFSYVAGFFYSDTYVNLYQDRIFPFAFDESYVKPDTKTAALYAHANWKVLDKTTITGGLRVNRDDISYNVDQILYTPVLVPVVSQGSHASESLVGDIGVKQQFTPQVQAYFTYTRGYAPEAYNTAFVLQPGAPLKPVSQEHINSFEVGTKGRYFDGRLQVNASLFDSVYDNYQVSTFINVPGVTAGLLDLSAAGQAETKGFELNTTWKPLINTVVTFNGALTDAKYNKYEGGPCYWGGSAALLPSTCYVASDGSFKANLSGKSMPNSPKAKFNVGVEQHIPLGSLPYDLSVGGDYAYRSSAQMLPDQNPESIQAAYGILNLHITLRSPENRYTLTIFGDNVTGTHYNVDYEDFWASVWGSNAIVVQPARDTNGYYGVRLSTHF